MRTFAAGRVGWGVASAVVALLVRRHQRGARDHEAEGDHPAGDLECSALIETSTRVAFKMATPAPTEIGVLSRGQTIRRATG
jgi:hypothetical protein